MNLDFDPASVLRSARERSGLTQRALADRAGGSQSVVARIERGQSSPTVGTLNRLLEATGHRIESRLVPTSEGFRARARAYFEGHAPAGIAAACLYGTGPLGPQRRPLFVPHGGAGRHRRCRGTLGPGGPPVRELYDGGVKSREARGVLTRAREGARSIARPSEHSRPRVRGAGLWAGHRGVGQPWAGGGLPSFCTRPR
jgi:transcriptional regulator with XRE-family HTH domain